MPEADARRRLTVEVAGAAEPVVARALWRLDDARRRTSGVLGGLTQDALDWVPASAGNSIGTTLYHLAAIESDYLFADILGRGETPPEVMTWFRHDVRDERGLLTAVQGVELAEHRERLDAIRARLRAALREMSAADFRRPRSLPTYDATPEWVLHHLTQHDAEHRGQIGELRLAAERELAAR